MENLIVAPLFIEILLVIVFIVFIASVMVGKWKTLIFISIIMIILLLLL